MTARIVLFSLLFGCYFQGSEYPVDSPSQGSTAYAESLAFSGREIHYNGQFEYSLHDCEGSHSEHLDQFKKRGYLQITVHRDQVKFLRRDKTQRLNVLVTSSWNRETQGLSRSRGFFGIAETEEWRESSGVLQLSRDSASGQITNIQILYKNNFCDVLFRFRGVSSSPSAKE